ncbi:hypothetical protein B0H13DRAFT_2302551 [Mycena leptocephala]|nr:hypothetical protein B0H13DRAFT_2302551 [Mycena leptocephala]
MHRKSTCDYCPGDEEEVAEDLDPHEDEEMSADDSEIPTREVVHHVLTKKTAKNRKIKAKAVAEDADAEVSAVDDKPDRGTQVEASDKRMRRPNPSAPVTRELWLRSNGSVPSRGWFIARIKHYFPHDVAGQSLRAGGATSLAEAGVPPNIIKAIGRWASGVFQIYIRSSLGYAFRSPRSPAPG